MAETNSILIKNIFIMLSYAFQVLQEENYKKVAAEEFQNMEDLLAAILAKGVAQQVKRGLYREYREQEDSLPVLRGKLELNGTFRHQWQQRRLLSCQYDELTQNNLYNQVIKTTLWALARSEAECTLSDVLDAASWALKSGGALALVHRPERLAEIFEGMRARSMEPKRLRLVQHTAASTPSLALVEGRRGGAPGLRVEPTLLLRDGDGAESGEYRRIYHMEER